MENKEKVLILHKLMKLTYYVNLRPNNVTKVWSYLDVLHHNADPIYRFASKIRNP